MENQDNKMALKKCSSNYIYTPRNCGILINSTGGGSDAEQFLYNTVISAGFNEFRDNIEDRA